jgi:hypothetical protein
MACTNPSQNRTVWRQEVRHSSLPSFPVQRIRPKIDRECIFAADAFGTLREERSSVFVRSSRCLDNTRRYDLYFTDVLTRLVNTGPTIASSNCRPGPGTPKRADSSIADCDGAQASLTVIANSEPLFASAQAMLRLPGQRPCPSLDPGSREHTASISCESAYYLL